MKGRLFLRAAGLALGAWLALAVGAFAAEVRVGVDVQPRLLRIGERAQLQIVFEGIDFQPDIQLPDIPDVSVWGPELGHSSSISIINGQTTQTTTLQYTWTLTPRRTGDIVLGPWDLDVGGKTLQFPRHVLVVKERDPVDDRPVESIFARVALPETPPVVGQDFPVIVEVWHLPELAIAPNVRVTGEGLPQSGFLRGDFLGLNVTRDERDGRIYQVDRYVSTWRARTAGEFPVAPRVEPIVLNPRSRDLFSRMMGMPVELWADPQTLRVEPVPTEGRPENWSGGVGRYRLAARAGPEEVRVGEPVTVTLTLSGDGDLETPRLPAYADTPEFRAHDPKAVADPTGRTRSVDQIIIPRTASLAELPALEFCAYDPEARAYVTQTVGPFPLRVEPAEQSSALLVTPDGPAAAAGPVLLGSDIHYLLPIPADVRRPLPRPVFLALAALHGAALLGLGVLAVVQRRRRRFRSDVAFARRHRAPRVSRAHLRGAERLLARGAAPAEVLDELHLAVTAYFAHRLNLPPGDATPQRVLDALPAGATALREGFADFFALADSVRYGSSAVDPATLADWPARLAKLLRDAERTAP